MNNFIFDIPSDLVGVLYDALYSAFERRSFAFSKMKALRSDYVNPALDSNLVSLEFLLHELNIQQELQQKEDRSVTEADFSKFGICLDGNKNI